jgi:multicomponent Na+:H+ antiporter subunit C
VGVYLALSRDALRIVLGLAVLGSAANLVLFAPGRLGSALPAVVPQGRPCSAPPPTRCRRPWC